MFAVCLQLDATVIDQQIRRVFISTVTRLTLCLFPFPLSLSSMSMTHLSQQLLSHTSHFSRHMRDYTKSHASTYTTLDVMMSCCRPYACQ